MGMYTEILIKCCIKENLPDDVKSVLDYLFGDGDEPDIPLPNHPFFKCSRWEDIGSMSSYYHIPASLCFYDEGYLFSRSDLKNYDRDIEEFFDWIMPYIDALPGQCIGYRWYEEDKVPTLVFKI